MICAYPPGNVHLAEDVPQHHSDHNVVPEVEDDAFTVVLV